MWSSYSWKCQNDPYGCQSMVNLPFDFQAKYHVLLFLYYKLLCPRTNIFCRVSSSLSPVLTRLNWASIWTASLFIFQAKPIQLTAYQIKLVKISLAHTQLVSSSTVNLYKNIGESVIKLHLTDGITCLFPW